MELQSRQRNSVDVQDQLTEIRQRIESTPASWPLLLPPLLLLSSKALEVTAVGGANIIKDGYNVQRKTQQSAFFSLELCDEAASFAFEVRGQRVDGLEPLLNKTSSCGGSAASDIGW